MSMEQDRENEMLQILTVFVESINNLSREMSKAINRLQKRRFKRSFLRTFNHIQYCINKIRQFYSQTDENIKFIFERFENSFIKWLECNLTYVPDDFVYLPLRCTLFESSVGTQESIKTNKQDIGIQTDDNVSLQTENNTERDCSEEKLTTDVDIKENILNDNLVMLEQNNLLSVLSEIEKQSNQSKLQDSGSIADLNKNNENNTSLPTLNLSEAINLPSTSNEDQNDDYKLVTDIDIEDTFVTNNFDCEINSSQSTVKLNTLSESSSCERSSPLLCDINKIEDNTNQRLSNVSENNHLENGENKNESVADESESNSDSLPSSVDDDAAEKLINRLLAGLTDEDFENSIENNTDDNLSFNLDDDDRLELENRLLMKSQELDTSCNENLSTDCESKKSSLGDFSDDGLKVEVQKALKIISDSSLSDESEESEKSDPSLDEMIEQTFETKTGTGTIRELSLNETSNFEENTIINSQKECRVVIEKLDFSNIQNGYIKLGKSNDENDLKRLLRMPSICKRTRPTSSSSNESNINRKFPLRKRSKPISYVYSSDSSERSSTSSKIEKRTTSNISTSLSSINSNFSDDYNSVTNSWKLSSLDTDCFDSGDSLELSEGNDSHKSKKKSSFQEKMNKVESIVKTEVKIDNKKNDENSEWRNDPLLNLNINIKDKSKSKIKNKSDSSDIEIICSSEDDVVIIQDDCNKKKNVVPHKKKIKSSKYIFSSDSDEEFNKYNFSDDDIQKNTEEEGKIRTRKVMTYGELAEQTKKANEEEKIRLHRLSQRQDDYKSLSESFTEPVNGLVLEYDLELKKPRIQVHEHLFEKLKEHQKDGVKFMWDSCFESIDQIPSNPGSGCVLAHCMGLGKTLQVITLVHTLFSYKETCVKRVLILGPATTITNWKNEFELWLSNLEKLFTVYTLQETNTNQSRSKIIKQWLSNGGVMILNYSRFRIMIGEEQDKNEKKQTFNKYTPLFRKALINPGPHLLICDEAHLLKNNKTLNNRSISLIRTSRRIMLTGTPMQNNLKEYYCMINLVKPNLLGSKTEFANQFVNPITAGQARDSSINEIKLMKRRAHVLHKKLSGVVQRLEGSILKPYLPPLTHYVLFIKLSKEQTVLYKEFIKKVKSSTTPVRLFKQYQLAKKIQSHPLCLIESSKNEQKIQTTTMNEETINTNESFNWQNFFTEDKLKTPQCGTKLLVLFHILNQCEFEGDKVIAFSTSLVVMDVIEFFLKKGPIDGVLNGKWELNQDYARVDGKTQKMERHEVYNKFNNTNNSRLRFLLASTGVTGLGLNLCGANRIILLDTPWNPAETMQCVYRIYRFGQQKSCYIYSLVSMGTMEEKIYERSVTKQAVSCRVVDEQQINRHYFSGKDVIKEFFNFIDYDKLERPKLSRPNDRILAITLTKFSDEIWKYHEHDKLLQNQEEEELDDTERELAWKEFQMEEERLKNNQLNLGNDKTLQNITNISDKSATNQPSNLFVHTNVPSFVQQIINLNASTSNQQNSTQKNNLPRRRRNRLIIPQTAFLANKNENPLASLPVPPQSKVLINSSFIRNKLNNIRRRILLQSSSIPTPQRSNNLSVEYGNTIQQIPLNTISLPSQPEIITNNLSTNTESNNTVQEILNVSSNFNNNNNNTEVSIEPPRNSNAIINSNPTNNTLSTLPETINPNISMSLVSNNINIQRDNDDDVMIIEE